MIKKRFIAVNGSPRKNWNIDLMISKVLEGCKSVQQSSPNILIETKKINLIDLNFKGCDKNFPNGVKSVNQCFHHDQLIPLLDEIRTKCDGLIIGSPIFSGFPTSISLAFLERLQFPNLRYAKNFQDMPIFGRKMKTAMVYTMGCTEKDAAHYQYVFDTLSSNLSFLFGTKSENLYTYDTMQTDNYSKHGFLMFDAEQKKKNRETIFQKDLKKAYELGKRMAF